MEEFFDSKHIKAIRRLPSGDTIALIYLKLHTKCLKKNGYYYFDETAPTIEEEISSFLEEDVNMVKLTLEALKKFKLIDVVRESELYLPTTDELKVGSEAESTVRSREYRYRKKQEKLLQCNTTATQVQQNATKCNDILDIDIEEEREIELELKEEIDLDKELEKEPELKIMVKTLINENLLTYFELKKHPYLEKFRWSKKYITFGSAYEIAKNILANLPAEYESRFVQFDDEFVRKVAREVIYE